MHSLYSTCKVLASLRSAEGFDYRRFLRISQSPRGTSVHAKDRGHDLYVAQEAKGLEGTAASLCRQVGSIFT
jgi:hypothetical protein